MDDLYGRANGKLVALGLENWAPLVANDWRSVGDTNPAWGSVTHSLDIVQHYPASSSPGGWNDADMMEEGVIDYQGSTPYSYLPDLQGQAQQSMWAMADVELIAGADLTQFQPLTGTPTPNTTNPNSTYPLPTPEYTLASLTNPEVITVSQDPLGIQGDIIYQTNTPPSGTPISGNNGAAIQVWAKPLVNGEAVVAQQHLRRQSEWRFASGSWPE